MVRLRLLLVFGFVAITWSTIGIDTYSSYCDPQFSYEPLPTGYQLKKLFVVLRHGDRTPFVFPFPYEDSAEWVCNTSFGKSLRINYKNSGPLSKHFWKGNCTPLQLTQKGINQMKDLGRSFSEAYGDFINWEYSQSQVYGRATQVGSERTFQSLLAFILGVFPKVNQSEISIESYSHEVETLFANKYTCPNAIRKRNEFFASKQFREFMDKYSTLTKKYEKLFHTKNDSSFTIDMQKYFDIIQTRMCHSFDAHFNNTLTDDDISMTLQAGKEEFILFYSQPEMIKYQTAFFNDELSQMIQSSVANTTSTPSLYLFCGHDTTIAPFLQLLQGIPPTDWVPYGASVVFEILEKKVKQTDCEEYDFGTSLFVRALYNGKPLEIYSPKQKNLKKIMPLEEFLQILTKWHIVYENSCF